LNKINKTFVLSQFYERETVVLILLNQNSFSVAANILSELVDSNKTLKLAILFDLFVKTPRGFGT